MVQWYASCVLHYPSRQVPTHYPNHFISAEPHPDLSSLFLDVVKTRLQTEAKSGQTHYKGMVDAFVKICECDLLAWELVIKSD